MAIRQAGFGSRWASVIDVATRLEKARSNRQAQQRLLGSLEEKVECRKLDVARSLSDLPGRERSAVINKAVAGYRNELKRESADTRLAYVREAGRHQSETRSVQTHYRSPVQMLVRHSLGSERRSRIMQQIERSGPAELASLAELAAATNDLELGAALCSRVADIMPDKRPFSSIELADALLGEEFRKVSQALMEIDRLAQEAVRDDTSFERGGARDAQRDLSIALLKKAEGEAGSDPDDDSDEEEQ